MRVLFAIGSLGCGGAERRVIHYLRHLDRRRFTPLLYLSEDQGPLRSDVPTDVPVLSFQSRHPQVARRYPGYRFRCQCADLALVLDEQRVDVLCAVTFHLTMVAGTAATRRPTPWLAMETANPEHDFAIQVRRYRWLKKKLLQRAYGRASLCVAVSDSVAATLAAQYRIAGRRIVTLPNCVDIEWIDRLAEASGPTLPPDRYHIVNVARLDIQKGQIHLLEALHMLVQQPQWQHLHVHILGEGPLENSLRDFVRRHQLERYVTWAGHVANPYAYIKQCDLFCLPSLSEGMPLSLLEAMACRMPVVVSRCHEGIAEVLDGGRLGRLVPPGDPRQLAEAIAQSASNAPDPDMLEEERRRVAANYSTKVIVPQLEELIVRVGTELDS